ncbi:aminotransferase class III-fold pyridoxal phosphate-dependent enzyme [Sulfitobacter sp. JBTF-M27]|uniref:Aminotransferase class III-fold pyridoxal phosphate-dependent enzyme n=1 Tax=Sulfitobacter sediminilitoris TaxID=2698830 RepID=A0A6P0C8E5_9RHOB|nr:aspartate aminotransferase family protein [Sulfitobacter sediminilitoris]NEK21418.1 aminotransferase class III-fold pyridoxal phosphate-dependent enzyme [Sulfitobacter sediminilitoris]
MSSITNHLPTAELQALDAAHHMHPFTTGDEINAKGARVITRAKGVYLTDSDGNEILDAMAGLWCVNLGYGRPEMGQVAARQMNELPYYNTFFQTTHVPVIALAKELADLAPGHLNHVFFAGSGSEANDTNLRMIRTYWAEKGQPEKSHVISRKNAYHGSSIGSGSLGGMTYMHAQGGMPIPGIHHIGQPDWWAEGGDHTPEEFGLARAKELEEKILELGAEKVAAFIGEPVQGAGGVIIPPSTYWPEIQRTCKKYDVLLIADEVICGFGRTGNWFGSQTMDITPDIMTIAKGLSSGYAPIGGSIVSDEIAEVINACEFNHGYTYSGHPVCASVALENLRIMQEEDLLSHVRNVAMPALHAALEELGDHPLVGGVNVSGMMASLPLTPHKESRAMFAGEKGTVGYMCREHCFANNLVMRHVGDRMIISPPLVITPEEIEVFGKRAKLALDATYKDLKDKDMLKAAS